MSGLGVEVHGLGLVHQRVRRADDETAWGREVIRGGGTDSFRGVRVRVSVSVRRADDETAWGMKVIRSRGT